MINSSKKVKIKFLESIIAGRRCDLMNVFFVSFLNGRRSAKKRKHAWQGTKENKNQLALLWS